jgi:hypothetical protein
VAGDDLLRNAFLIAVGLIGGAIVLGAVGSSWLVRPDRAVSVPSAAVLDEDPLEVGEAWERARKAGALSAEDRARGRNECALPDPGMGVYAPYQPIHNGRVLIPRSGGHTDDMGFDVVVHFHGHDAIRKILVQASRGVVFAGIESGVGSGAYTNSFNEPIEFQRVVDSIEAALQQHTNNPAAHIRHLAISGWSAGYGAAEAILKGEGDSRIDAVILLDGFHASWFAAGARDDDPASIDLRNLASIVSFAQRAARGEKLFYLSHSQIGTDYPSTTRSSRALLAKLHLQSTPVEPGDPAGEGPFGLEGKVDEEGFHLRSFRGRDAHAHCDHLRHFDEALGDIVERAWQTPEANDAKGREEPGNSAGEGEPAP